jgi:hypothetical protein
MVTHSNSVHNANYFQFSAGYNAHSQLQNFLDAVIFLRPFLTFLSLIIVNSSLSSTEVFNPGDPLGDFCTEFTWKNIASLFPLTSN